jgi:hypothetical protein
MVSGLRNITPEALTIGRFASRQTKAPTRTKSMKTILCTLLFLCGTAAFSQVGTVLTNTAQPLQMMDHVGRASVHAMGTETTLLDTSVYSYSKGETPLSELGSIEYETPLGDVARALKKQRAASPTPKAVKVFEK